MPGCRSNDPNGGSEHDCWVYPNTGSLSFDLGLDLSDRRVALWRKGGYVGVTPTTAQLVAYWKLFFCQNEALEIAIWRWSEDFLT